MRFTVKHKIATLLIVLSVSFSWSQNKTIDNILKFKMQNSGAIMDDNNVVDGYYFFYEVDKVSRKEREYAITFLDQNLNDVATRKFVQRKGTILLSTSFNNQVTMLALMNVKEKQIILKSFDREANALKDVVIQLEKRAFTLMKYKALQGVLQNVLFPIDDKGFLLNYMSMKDKKPVNKIAFYPTNGGEYWEREFVPEKGHIQTLLPLSTEENYLVLVESLVRGRKVKVHANILDVNNGKEIFASKYDVNDPKLISNSFITPEGNIAILGQYYKPNAKIARDESLGLFVKMYDATGKILSENKMSWAVDVNEKLKIKRNSKMEDVGYIFFHDIIRTQEGNYYAIGEQYKKTANGAGIALGILGAALGGGIQTSGYTQLTIKDAYIFKFDKDFNLNEIEIFEKGKSRVPNLYDFGSPQLNAFQIKAFGGFDYVYSQIDVEKDRFYANFVDYERLKDEDNKFAFKTIIYDDGELSEDKIYLPNKGRKVITRPFPGKLGHVLIFEYNKKKKSAYLHLEKLNIK